MQFLRNPFHRRAKTPLVFTRPLVVLQSDDWGRVGVRDKEGHEQIRAQGIRLGEHPYDLYSLETADDLDALASFLSSHHDARGRPPCMMMNFCVANLDFAAMRQKEFREIKLLPLARGLPGRWSRPGLLEAYRGGIKQRVFAPALHGLTHFCAEAIECALCENRERARLLRQLWDAETPYIYWRMPWIGFEYWNPETRGHFLSGERQRNLVRQARSLFTELFRFPPESACAPGYRSNSDTYNAWAENGICVAEHGSGNGLRPPYVDESGTLHVFRAIDFEPSQRAPDPEAHLQIAGACFARGIPLILSVHSVNFQSSLKDFRSPTLAGLDSLLSALESRYPELLYVSDNELYSIAMRGEFRPTEKRSSMPVKVEGTDTETAWGGI